ncbi:MAG: hypothetical protein ACFB4I_05055 [Cyanophyceae cyanobacterium]
MPLFCRQAVIAGVILGLYGCQTVTTNQYEATVETTLTWQVKYYQDRDRIPRLETFTSNTLISRNGLKSPEAVVGPDEKGLWWPAVPPRPTPEQIEQRQEPGEEIDRPELRRTADYRISYRQGDQQVTFPTNYEVYRQVARAYPERQPLQLTMGINERSVTKAEVP